MNFTKKCWRSRMNKENFQLDNCYPGTNVLINKFNIRDGEKLNKVEGIFSAKRLVELTLKPISGNFDLKHLQAIHKYIFQDVYEFAGKIRDVYIAKNHMLFAAPIHIATNFQELYRQLKAEKFLKGLNSRQFSQRAAYYMAEINVLHPFREGNGRAQREYLRTLALHNGWEIHWDRIEPKEFLSASIKSVQDPKELALLIEEAIKNK